MKSKVAMISATPGNPGRLYIYKRTYCPVAEVIHLDLAKCQTAQLWNACANGSRGSAKTLPLIWEVSRHQQVVPFCFTLRRNQWLPRESLLIKYNRTEFVISTRGAAGWLYVSTGIFHFDDTCHTSICFFSLVLEAISCPLGDLTKQMYDLTHVSLLFASHFLCYFLYLFSQVDIRWNEKVVCATSTLFSLLIRRVY